MVFVWLLNFFRLCHLHLVAAGVFTKFGNLPFLISVTFCILMVVRVVSETFNYATFDGLYENTVEIRRTLVSKFNSNICYGIVGTHLDVCYWLSLISLPWAGNFCSAGLGKIFLRTGQLPHSHRSQEYFFFVGTCLSWDKCSEKSQNRWETK